MEYSAPYSIHPKTISDALLRALRTIFSSFLNSEESSWIKAVFPSIWFWYKYIHKSGQSQFALRSAIIWYRETAFGAVFFVFYCVDTYFLGRELVLLFFYAVEISNSESILIEINIYYIKHQNAIVSISNFCSYFGCRKLLVLFYTFFILF